MGSGRNTTNYCLPRANEVRTGDPYLNIHTTQNDSSQVWIPGSRMREAHAATQRVDAKASPRTTTT